jgi:hypothetical protein
MTFREKYERDYADKIKRDNEIFPWYGCPCDYYNDEEYVGYKCPNSDEEHTETRCKMCWEREIPGTESTMPEPKWDAEVKRMYYREIEPFVCALMHLGVSWTLKHDVDTHTFTLTFSDKEKE